MSLDVDSCSHLEVRNNSFSNTGYDWDRNLTHCWGMPTAILLDSQMCSINYNSMENSRPSNRIRWSGDPHQVYGQVAAPLFSDLPEDNDTIWILLCYIGPMLWPCLPFRMMFRITRSFLAAMKTIAPAWLTLQAEALGWRAREHLATTGAKDCPNSLPNSTATSWVIVMLDLSDVVRTGMLLPSQFVPKNPTGPAIWTTICIRIKISATMIVGITSLQLTSDFHQAMENFEILCHWHRGRCFHVPKAPGFCGVDTHFCVKSFDICTLTFRTSVCLKAPKNNNRSVARFRKCIGQLCTQDFKPASFVTRRKLCCLFGSSLCGLEMFGHTLM